MSDGDSFIREVSEEVRRERFSKMLRRYGWIGALVILAIVGGAALNEWRKAQIRAIAEAAGETLRMAYLVEDPAGRAASLAEAAAAAPGSAAVARIAQAGALVEAGERQAAAEVLSAVAEDGAVAPVYRDLALLQRVAVLGADMDRTERLASLETLARPEGPFRALALEQRALVRLEAGEVDAARGDLEALLAEPALPEGLASRARQLLIAAGGALPGAALPDAMAPELLPEAGDAEASGAVGADG